MTPFKPTLFHVLSICAFLGTISTSTVPKTFLVQKYDIQALKRHVTRFIMTLGYVFTLMQSLTIFA